MEDYAPFLVQDVNAHTLETAANMATARIIAQREADRLHRATYIRQPHSNGFVQVLPSA